MMVAWALPRTTGRVYGYLLLRPDPATLDEIAADLEVAKSGASVATRQLVSFGMARTHRRRGSKQLGFDAIYDLAGVLAAREAQIRVFESALRHGAEVATSPIVRRKITTMTRQMEDLFARMASFAARPERRTDR